MGALKSLRVLLSFCPHDTSSSRWRWGKKKKKDGPGKNRGSIAGTTYSSSTTGKHPSILALEEKTPREGQQTISATTTTTTIQPPREEQVGSSPAGRELVTVPEPTPNPPPPPRPLPSPRAKGAAGPVLKRAFSFTKGDEASLSPERVRSIRRDSIVLDTDVGPRPNPSDDHHPLGSGPSRRGSGPPTPSSRARSMTKPLPPSPSQMDRAALQEVLDALAAALPHVPYAVCGLAGLAVWGFEARRPSHVSILVPAYSRDAVRYWAASSAVASARGTGGRFVVYRDRPDVLGYETQDGAAVRKVRIKYVEGDVGFDHDGGGCGGGLLRVRPGSDMKYQGALGCKIPTSAWVLALPVLLDQCCRMYAAGEAARVCEEARARVRAAESVRRHQLNVAVTLLKIVVREDAGKNPPGASAGHLYKLAARDDDVRLPALSEEELVAAVPRPKRRLWPRRELVVSATAVQRTLAADILWILHRIVDGGFAEEGAGPLTRQMVPHAVYHNLGGFWPAFVREFPEAVGLFSLAGLPLMPGGESSGELPVRGEESVARLGSEGLARAISSASSRMESLKEEEGEDKVEDEDDPIGLHTVPEDEAARVEKTHRSPR